MGVSSADSPWQSFAIPATVREPQCGLSSGASLLDSKTNSQSRKRLGVVVGKIWLRLGIGKDQDEVEYADMA